MAASNIDIRVFNRSSPGTQLAALLNARDRSFLEDLNDLGSVQFSLPLGDADLAVADGSLVRCFVDTVAVFQGVLEQRRQVTVAEGEESQQWVTCTGGGAVGLLRQSLVYPELGVNRRPATDTRFFNWVSTDFLAPLWAPSFQVHQIGNTGGAYGGSPGNFPDPTAWWIWGQNPNPPATVGDNFFRRSFSVPGEGTFRVFFSADDGIEIWIDGGMLASETKAYLWGETKYADIFLDAGTHLIAVKGSNISRPSSPGTNRAAVVVAIYSMKADGAADQLIVHTDGSWVSVAYPPGPPGMTPGNVIKILLAEAQTRGELPGITLGFNEAFDSAGVPWPIVADISLGVGMDYFSALRQLGETYLDFAMRPSTLVLDAWTQRGSSSGVTLNTGYVSSASVLQHVGHDTDHGARHTKALVRYSDGYSEVIHGLASSIGHRGLFLQAGDAPSKNAANQMALAILNQRSALQEQVTASMLYATGTVPWIDFEVGDFVTAPSRAGGTESMRVTGLTVQEDENAFLTFTPELKLGQTPEEVLLERILNRMTPGGAGSGVLESASLARGFGGKDASVLQTFAAFPPFSLPGAVTANQVSGKYTAEKNMKLVRLMASLAVAGTSTTTVIVRRNLVQIAVLTLTSGQTFVAQDVSSRLTAEVDYITVETTATVGAGAQRLVVQGRAV